MTTNAPREGLDEKTKAYEGAKVVLVSAFPRSEATVFITAADALVTELRERVAELENGLLLAEVALKAAQAELEGKSNG
jgi:hypothetical protein